MTGPLPLLAGMLTVIAHMSRPSISPLSGLFACLAHYLISCPPLLSQEPTSTGIFAQGMCFQIIRPVPESNMMIVRLDALIVYPAAIDRPTLTCAPFGRFAVHRPFHKLAALSDAASVHAKL
jgi:hypothetical protein